MLGSVLRRAVLFDGTLLDPDNFRLEQENAANRSIQIEIDEGAGFERWREVPDFVGLGSGERVFVLDRADGSVDVRFGDGVQGRRPAAGSAVRAFYGRGAGAAGLVAGAAFLTGIVLGRRRSLKQNG
jgi:hypothetical protein